VRSSQNEPVTFRRDCPAVLIPAGEQVNIPSGSTGFLTQALGGNFTVYIDGNLFRLAGENADAIGMEPTRAPQVPEDAGVEVIEALIWQQLKTCYDPEIPINIVDLGLIYKCDLEATGPSRWRARVAMTLTAPGCGMGDILAQDVREKIELIPNIDGAEVELVFDPPWNQSMMSEEARLEAGLL
jgi:probable FeS assembly SUF system protein SufT